MKKRAKLEEIKRLFEAHEELTVKELKLYTKSSREHHKRLFVSTA